MKTLAITRDKGNPIWLKLFSLEDEISRNGTFFYNICHFLFFCVNREVTSKLIRRSSGSREISDMSCTKSEE